jgi:hypothetical protein
MSTVVAIPAVLAEELVRYQTPAPDGEFQDCQLARHYQCIPQFAADRLQKIAAECLAAGIDLGPVVTYLEAYAANFIRDAAAKLVASGVDPGPAIALLETRPVVIGRIRIFLQLRVAIAAADVLRQFADSRLEDEDSIDDVIGLLESQEDVLGLVKTHLQLHPVHLVSGYSYDDIVGYLESTSDLLGVVIIHLQLLAATPAAAN